MHAYILTHIPAYTLTDMQTNKSNTQANIHTLHYIALHYIALHVYPQERNAELARTRHPPPEVGQRHEELVDFVVHTEDPHDIVLGLVLGALGEDDVVHLVHDLLPHDERGHAGWPGQESLAIAHTTHVHARVSRPQQNTFRIQLKHNL